MKDTSKDNFKKMINHVLKYNHKIFEQQEKRRKDLDKWIRKNGIIKKLLNKKIK